MFHKSEYRGQRLSAEAAVQIGHNTVTAILQHVVLVEAVCLQQFAMHMSHSTQIAGNRNGKNGGSCQQASGQSNSKQTNAKTLQQFS